MIKGALGRNMKESDQFKGLGVDLKDFYWEGVN
jgi:hypothetical protein